MTPPKTHGITAQTALETLKDLLTQIWTIKVEEAYTLWFSIRKFEEYHRRISAPLPLSKSNMIQNPDKFYDEYLEPILQQDNSYSTIEEFHTSNWESFFWDNGVPHVIELDALGLPASLSPSYRYFKVIERCVADHFGSLLQAESEPLVPSRIAETLKTLLVEIKLHPKKTISQLTKVSKVFGNQENDPIQLSHIYAIMEDPTTLKEFETGTRILNIYRKEILEIPNSYFGRSARYKQSETEREGEVIIDDRHYQDLFGMDKGELELFASVLDQAESAKAPAVAAIKARCGSMVTVCAIYLNFARSGSSYKIIGNALGVSKTLVGDTILAISPVVEEFGIMIIQKCSELFRSPQYLRFQGEIAEQFIQQRPNSYGASQEAHFELKLLLRELFDWVEKGDYHFQTAAFEREIISHFTRLPYYPLTLLARCSNEAVDGTHLHVKVAAREAEEHRCYKQYTSINAIMSLNVQHILYTDAILTVGRAHDSGAYKGVFDATLFAKTGFVQLEKARFALGRPTEEQYEDVIGIEPDDDGAGIGQGSVFQDLPTIGDNAFGNGFISICPFRDGMPAHWQDTLKEASDVISDQQVFNYFVDLARNPIERSFGWLKAIFQSLSSTSSLRQKDTAVKDALIMGIFGTFNFIRFTKSFIRENELDQTPYTRGSRSFNMAKSFIVKLSEAEISGDSIGETCCIPNDDNFMRSVEVSSMENLHNILMELRILNTVGYERGYSTAYNREINVQCEMQEEGIVGIHSESLLLGFTLDDVEVLNMLCRSGEASKQQKTSEIYLREIIDSGSLMSFKQLMVYNFSLKERLKATLKMSKESISELTHLEIFEIKDIMINVLHDYWACRLVLTAFESGLLTVEHLNSIREYGDVFLKVQLVLSEGVDVEGDEAERLTDELDVQKNLSFGLGKARRAFQVTIFWAYYLLADENGVVDCKAFVEP